MSTIVPLCQGEWPLSNQAEVKHVNKREQPYCPMVFMLGYLASAICLLLLYLIHLLNAVTYKIVCFTIFPCIPVLYPWIISPFLLPFPTLSLVLPLFSYSPYLIVSSTYFILSYLFFHIWENTFHRYPFGSVLWDVFALLAFWGAHHPAPK